MTGKPIPKLLTPAQVIQIFNENFQDFRSEIQDTPFYPVDDNESARLKKPEKAK